ncbi:MAG: hypothetical protein C0520_14340, partial [Sphingopyxis sp.]|nr:hypothetical protein [Sphingopyxis sp.]
MTTVPQARNVCDLEAGGSRPSSLTARQTMLRLRPEGGYHGPIGQLSQRRNRRIHSARGRSRGRLG